ncbi:MAG: hypothetical protein CVT95_08210 [Bacteroidetes bacterium HGW-Bacteroidetes-12]|nr:MAG: hypothetical protein CVT95_08210 [Bacteroidetes bacterium HGW-Bacteroidetes-12]
MQLLSFDESENSYKNNQYISATLQLFDGKNLLYSRFYHQTFKPENELLQQIFNNLTVGDSAIFFIDATEFNSNFFEIKLPTITSNQLFLYVKVYHYFDEKENKHFLENLDSDLIEYQYLDFYIKNVVPTAIKKNGVYVAIIEKGNGETVKKNDIIQLKYKGYFLNHVLFDETPEDGFLEFEYGTPNQVIRGIEIAIKDMKVGEKSKIIIPSHLAFGVGGSSTGRIPPATPVMYELEIVKINKLKNN